jgi:DNA-directed RNA polymerase subunit RPC12/RpoP
MHQIQGFAKNVVTKDDILRTDKSISPESDELGLFIPCPACGHKIRSQESHS